MFSELEDEFDVNNEQSFLYSFNNLSNGSSLQVSQRFTSVFNYAKQLYEFTDHKFNPTLLSLSELWQFQNYPVLNFSPPSLTDIENLKGSTDFSNVTLIENLISKTDPNTKLDFGGILKGYAVDYILEELLNVGCKNGYVSVGGSSLALLSVPTLTVRNPRATDNLPYALTINCQNKNNVTLSTSGDYERFYEYQGERFSHLIDGETGAPTTSGVISATMLGANGSFTDAITTALCLSPHNSLDLNSSELVNLMRKILLEYPNAEFYVFYEKDSVKQLLTNKNQGEDFTLLDSRYSVVKI